VLHTDKPIEKKTEDRLGRKDFVENVAKAISHYQTGQDSLVMGLCGEWGSGKTSVINMIIESLNEQDSAPITVRFCPWYFSGQDQLLQQFFLQLASEIRSSFEKATDATQDLAKKAGEVADKIIKFSAVIRPIKHITPFVGVPSGVIDGIFNSIDKTAGKVKEITDAVGKLNEQDSFDPYETKKEIGSALSELDRKVLIIIDDIDRLTREEIRQIFQLVKALADFKNTIYLLSFDQKEVCAALKEQTDHPERYLEKIVQIPFELPTVSPTVIFGHLTKSLDNLIVKEDWNPSLQKHWDWLCYHGFKSYITNLREVSRFLNLCQFNYHLLNKEVNLVDLFVMTATSIKHPDLYRFIKENKSIFCGPEGTATSGRAEERDQSAKEQYQAFRNQIADIEKVEPLLTELFPYLHKILSESRWGSGLDQRELERSQRIASRKYFDRFFSLSVPEGQISDQAVHVLIALQDKSEILLERMQDYSYQQQRDLINIFYTHKDEFTNANVVSVAEALMPLAENVDESDYSGFFSSPLSDYIRLFIRDLFAPNEATATVKLDYYNQLFNSPKAGAYMMSSLLWYVMEIVGAKDGEGNFKRELLEQSQFKDKYEELEGKLVAKIEQLARENSLQQHHHMTAILYAWQRANSDAPKDYVNALTRTDQGLIEFITASLGYSHSGNGKTPRIHWNYVADFVTDTAAFVERAKEIKKNQEFALLPEKSRVAIDVFLRSAENPNQDI